MIEDNNPVLLVIDVQEAIDSYSEMERSNPQAEENIAQILCKWRAEKRPIIHVRHSSKYRDSPYHRSSPGFAFKKAVAPEEDDVVVTKSENCAFLNTGLKNHIDGCGSKTLVVCGVLVNNSIDATIRVAAGLGYSVYLPQDATAAFGMRALNGKYYASDDVHWLSLSNLDGEYCTVTTVAQVLGI
ncbi:isochorismatase family protein [Microbulbifer elongatus]|uniref:Isochorismatase family protein n=1 Tax=Microbulbifer elongatus TaxID=86173 RepID=A0ABT1NZ67_9GAMM|nr:isochorismatase family protein [Microbulbifer elongatus]MCQ3829147.1 isochorismatase family protein [Microbulbifer elongatus]